MCGLRPFPGVRVRRRDVPNADLVGIDGIRLTDVPLTALDTAATLPDGSAFLDRALQKHVRFPRLYRAYCRNLGAEGFARVNELLVGAADRADSAAERLLTALLRRHGVTGWQCALAFERWTIDVAFASARVAVEVDGWAWHVDAERFRADRRKGNALVRAGWLVLRFTWHDLTARPADVVAEIVEALASRPHRP